MANDKVHNWNSLQDTIFNYVQQNLSTDKPIEDRFYVVIKKGYVTKVRVIPHMFYGSIPYQDIEDRKSSRRLLKSLKNKDFSNLINQDLFVMDVCIGFDSEKQMYELEHTIPELFFYKTNANKK
jgi:transcriptional regulator of NAD metabolism